MFIGIKQSVTDLTKAINDTRSGYGAITDQISKIYSSAPTVGEVQQILQTVANSEFAPDSCKDNKPLTAEWSTFRKTCQTVGESLPEMPYIVRFGTKSGSRYVTVTAVTRDWIAAQDERKKQDEQRDKARQADDKAMAETVAKMQRGKLLSESPETVYKEINDFIASRYGDGEVAGILAGCVQARKLTAEQLGLTVKKAS